LGFALCQEIIRNISGVVVGKTRPFELLLVALLAEGHVLLEDVPGVGKTLLAKSLARSMGGFFKRVQFTPDLLPADITGFNVYDRAASRFVFQPGPVMTNVLLADEINRTIPRTQASLLESMEEGQVTVDGETIALPRPFFVVATQNPIELEGTFPLPEAQMDRFLLRVDLGYPSREEERLILERFQQEDPLETLQAVTTPEKILEMQRERRNIRVSPDVQEYIVSITEATRNSNFFRFGASPRSSLHLMRGAQAYAALCGREYVLPDDVKYLAGPVLAHRLVLRSEEKIRGATVQKVMEKLLAEVSVPSPKE